MRIIVLKLVFLLSVVSPASGQYVGLSSFAAFNPKFPCEQFLQISDASKFPAMSILWGTFGDDYTCLARFTDRFKDRYHLVQIHLSNETCRPPRGNPCGANELGLGISNREWNRLLAIGDPGAYQQIEDRLQNILSVANATGNTHTTYLLSTGLEDGYDRAAYAKLYRFVRDRWPYLMVRNPVGGNKDGSVYLGDFRERHGGRATCNGASAVVNEDGDTSQGTSDSIRYVRRNGPRCLATFLWRARHQGRSGGFRFLSPPDRTFAIPESDVRNFRKILAAYK